MQQRGVIIYSNRKKERLNMDDFDKKSGELNGFDSVNGNDTPGENSGYTVTPDGGFYTKSREL